MAGGQKDLNIMEASIKNVENTSDDYQLFDPVKYTDFQYSNETIFNELKILGDFGFGKRCDFSHPIKFGKNDQFLCSKLIDKDSCQKNLQNYDALSIKTAFEVKYGNIFASPNNNASKVLIDWGFLCTQNEEIGDDQFFNRSQINDTTEIISKMSCGDQNLQPAPDSTDTFCTNVVTGVELKFYWAEKSIKSLKITLSIGNVQLGKLLQQIRKVSWPHETQKQLQSSNSPIPSESII